MNTLEMFWVLIASDTAGVALGLFGNSFMEWVAVDSLVMSP